MDDQSDRHARNEGALCWLTRDSPKQNNSNQSAFLNFWSTHPFAQRRHQHHQRRAKSASTKQNTKTRGAPRILNISWLCWLFHCPYIAEMLRCQLTMGDCQGCAYFTCTGSRA